MAELSDKDIILMPLVSSISPQQGERVVERKPGRGQAIAPTMDGLEEPGRGQAIAPTMDGLAWLAAA